MKVQPRLYKGTRDFLPEQMIKRNYVISIIREIFEKYGFEPLETPTIEMWDTLSGKYGEEGDRLTYRFTDRGDREVGLRYDLTVPFSRVMGMYPSLPKPFKRYQIQPVWRADKPQKGRFREFYQCDVDVVGSKSIIADAEVVAVIAEVLRTLEFKKFTIRVNSRKVLAGIVEASGAGANKEMDIYRSIDKLDKIGLDGVSKELQNRGVNESAANIILDLLKVDGKNEERLAKATEALKDSDSGMEGIREVTELFTYLEKYGVGDNEYRFDLTLARGLDYYTGIICETVVEEPKIGSITGGGRYDNLIGMFSKNTIPATGGSFGLERIITVMDELDMFPANLKTSTEVLVTVFNPDSLPYSIEAASVLRAAGIKVDLYTEKAKLNKQFKFANEKQIPFVIVAGPDEAERREVALKQMESGDQETVKLSEIATRIKALLER
ncbi:MAG: histidine--tRNA ligase [Calditrichota bacterium]